MSDDENKSPLEILVELGLYAPLGAALIARDNLPDLIARGRKQVSSQVALARMMGKYAVAEGEKDLRKRIEELSATLSGLGLLPEQTPPARTTNATTPPKAGVTVDGSPPASNGSAAGTTAAKDPAPSRRRADLAIPGYDTLSASQVVQRLAGLAVDELEAVRDYESGARGRRTILSKITQLQTGSSA